MKIEGRQKICIARLLDQGADIDAVSGKYGTTLAAAVFKGKMGIVSLLLDRGTDINAVGGEYWTALVAEPVFERRMQIALLLLLHLVGVRILCHCC